MEKIEEDEQKQQKRQKRRRPQKCYILLDKAIKKFVSDELIILNSFYYKEKS